MRIFNAKQPSKEGLYQISIQDGVITNIEKQSEVMAMYDEEYSIDAEGGLVIPPLVDSHSHLDTTITAGDPVWNESGTLYEGFDIWSQRRESIDEEDVRKRAAKALKWQIAQGVQFVRTHVDVGDPELKALKAMLKIREEWAPWITIQIVAFPQDGIFTGEGMLYQLEKSLNMGADAIGAIPHVEYLQEESTRSIKEIFNLAKKYNCMVDVHCDEVDDEQSKGLEAIATEAYRSKLGSLVTASHTCALSSYNEAYAAKLFKLVQKANINFVANPLVNIHLQGRYDQHPKRRGLTRVKELIEAGINISFGHDNVIDPFYPLGKASMLQVLHMGVHIAHLTGYQELQKALDLITVNGAKTMNVEDQYGVEEGKPGNLIILPVASSYEAIRLQPNIRYSIRKGVVISETKPVVTQITLKEKENIDFLV